jgi:hypothetical protein
MLKSRTVSWSAVDGALRETWTRMASRLHFNPTLKPDWVKIVTRSLRGPGEEPSVFLEEDGAGQLSTVVPFFASSVQMEAFPTRVVQPASNVISYHAEPVTSGGHRDFLQRMLAEVPRWDLRHAANLDLQHICQD